MSPNLLDSLDDLATANPGIKISLRGELIDAIDDIKTGDASSALKSIFNRHPLLKKALSNPEALDDISLQESQELINFLNTKIPKTIKANNIEVINLTSDIRAAQLEAFPQMASVRDAYHKGIEPLKNLKTHFKFNRVIKAIESDFGGEEGMKALKQIFTPDVIKQIGGFKKARQIIKGSKHVISWILKATAVGTAVGLGAKMGISRRGNGMDD
jgi:hypothetical protein